MISENNTSLKRPAGASGSPRMSNILGSFLECIIHEILYTRSLYPNDAFSPTRFYGISCHACRHPQVVDYVVDSLHLAVASILSGVSDRMKLILYDDSTDEIFEIYKFQFKVDEIVHIIQKKDSQMSTLDMNQRKIQSFESTAQPSEREELETKIGELERGMRDVLLKIVSLDGTTMGRKRGMKPFPPNATFKLCIQAVNGDLFSSSDTSNQQDIHHSHDSSGDRKTCPELEEALSNGKWFRPDPNTCEFSGHPQQNSAVVVEMDEISATTSRSLKSLHVPSCGISMELDMEYCSSKEMTH